jgi:hypothetical protein
VCWLGNLKVTGLNLDEEFYFFDWTIWTCHFLDLSLCGCSWQHRQFDYWPSLLVARILFGGLENLPENVKKLCCLFAKKSPKLCAGEIRKIITTLSI